MDSVYQPLLVEPKWSKLWLERKIFHAKVNRDKKPFSMVIPPPNITGSLHMGHALNNTIQDILNRSKKMQGFEACWLPGTDHAGIATQVVVERELRKEKVSRHDLGREKFIERVWEWRKQYGGIIDDQLKKLGVSCDWDRYSFTMDETRSRAVIEAFVRLYEKGVIYRDRYIVNWCPKCQTALSDLEVEHPENEAPGVLYHLRYPLEDGSGSITVATVRPETILGDVAVAVHPTDSRYKKLIGKTVVLPLVGRKLKIIADEWADPKVGSGAVKITPAHDPNDFEVGRRHKLDPIVVIDGSGKMSTLFLGVDALKKYHGLDRFECRTIILEDLKANGVLQKEEPWPSNPGRCARSGDVIEPYLSIQWFARMKDLAAPAILVVKKGETQFHPDRFSKIYFDWMENIRDWCISRQLWWGHRIPAWYCEKCGGKPIVSRDVPSACPTCHGKELMQDPDVLDTWFSSGLWPLSTMGWPNETEELKYFYPTTVLSTGRDIIFLWVARMMMMGLEFKKQIPFHHIYIHPTILDREGRRMSKSKGTGVDPLDLISKYGADATRFGMILMCQGQDVRFNEEKIAQGRNFANKLWNASRFVLSLLSGDSPREVSPISSDLTFYDHWILSKMQKTITSVNHALEEYEFALAASTLYEFVWDDFCDWYLELSKFDSKRNLIVVPILVHVLTQTLKLLHPFIPFVTEEIWEQFSSREKLLLEESWPVADDRSLTKSDTAMERLIEVVRAARVLRAEIGLKPKDKAPLVIRTEKPSEFESMKGELIFLTTASTLGIQDEKASPPRKALSAHIRDASIYLPLEGLVDLDAELARLRLDEEKSSRELESVKKLLCDPAFSGKAKPEVIEKTKEKERLLRERLDRIKERVISLK